MLSFSVKLPVSGDFALTLPFTEPTGYGLGKSGWVTVRLSSKDATPLDMLVAWIEESYRAVAPKKLVTLLDAGEEEPGARSIRKTPARKKAAVRKSPDIKKTATGSRKH
jgi:hypothetical protein